ncbi:str-96 [Pristionchus pacificus]|uniref:G protein-coupled receptor n=1 Tax=Pristionchus pacificus TaxID=54126 RepID=A0A454XQI6_PRIPA|nr:str-96 [Pristionchus pacificus]|eukprot:PDM69552.1 G protein-coupled receptor [Pristionchus pacificus]
MLLSPWLVHACEKTNLCLGVFLNGFLMYLVGRHSHVGFGIYRNLLMSFATYDMFLSMLHMFMNPKTINVGTTFSVVSYSPIEHRYFSSIFCASFTVSFSIVNIHFLYRYWTVSKPAMLEYFKNFRFIIVLLLYIAADELSCYFRYTHLTVPAGTAGAEAVKAVFREKFNDTVEGGWLIVDYYQDGNGVDPLAFSFFLSGVAKMLLSASTAALLAGLTYAKILEARDKSFNFQAIQLAFLKTVIAQSAVPILFVYIPYFVVIFMPLMGMESSEIASYFPLMTSFFPALDAIVIITMIRDYREAAMRIFCCGRGKTEPLGLDRTGWSSNSDAQSQATLVTTVGTSASESANRDKYRDKY